MQKKKKIDTSHKRVLKHEFGLVMKEIKQKIKTTPIASDHASNPYITAVPCEAVTKNTK